MGEKIGLQDIIDALAEKCGLSKQHAETFVKATFDLIEESLETEQYVKIKGLGTFKLTEVSNRESVNVNTGERFVIEGHSKISFSPDPAMRDLINKPFAHFETVVLNDDTVLENTPDDDENIEEDAETEIADEKEAIVLFDNSEKDIKEQNLIPGNSLEPTIVDPAKETAIETIFSQPEEVSSESKEEDIQKNKIDSPDFRPSISQDNNSAINNGKGKRKWPYITGALLVSALLIAELFYFIFGPEDSKKVVMYMPESIQEDNLPTQPKVDDPMYDLSTKQEETSEPEQVEKDTIVPIKVIQSEIDTAKTVITGVRKGMNNVKPDSTSYLIVGTMTVYKIGAGETLTMVSKRFYETKDLWPYIVKHNRKVIKNPDRVPSGTTIRIPALRDRK